MPFGGIRMPDIVREPQESPREVSLAGIGVGWLMLISVLFVEFLILSIRFDAKSPAMSGWIRPLTERVSEIPKLVAVVFTVTLVFGSGQLSDAMSQMSKVVASHGRRAYFLIAHLMMFAALFAATWYVFEVDHGQSKVAFGLWVLVAVSTLVFWGAALIDPARWVHIGPKIIKPALAAVLIGLACLSAGQWATHSWSALSYRTFQLVGFMLSAMGLEIVQDAPHHIIGTPLFSVHIAPVCSGYEGMGMAVVFVTTYLWWRRSDHFFPQSLLLIPIAVAAMFLVNAMRIAMLVVIGHLGWKEFAIGGFHSVAGWFAFNLVALGLIVVARVHPFFCRQTFALPSPTSTPQAMPMLVPFVVLTLTIMATGFLDQGFDWAYPIRIVTVGATVGYFFRRYRPAVWKWSFDWVGPAMGLVVYLIWIALEPTSSVQSSGSFMDQLRGQTPVVLAAWLVCRVVGSVCTVPIAEEFAFRGYLLPWLGGQTESGTAQWSWTALLLSSAAFGSLHPGRWLAGTIAGMLYGITYYKRRVLMDAVLAHATTNGLIAFHVLLTSQWSLWS